MVTLALVAGLNRDNDVPLSTRDTVVVETPARHATSFMVTRLWLIWGVHTSRVGPNLAL
jgi:hypothetical protein